MSNSTRRVFARLPEDVYEYFFRHVLAGQHKAKQELLTQFFTALYQECQRRQLAPAWNIENTQVIAEIMSHLNFNNHDESDRSRCAGDPAPLDQTQPACSSDDSGTADRAGHEASPPEPTPIATQTAGQ